MEHRIEYFELRCDPLHLTVGLLQRAEGTGRMLALLARLLVGRFRGPFFLLPDPEGLGRGLLGG